MRQSRRQKKVVEHRATRTAKKARERKKAAGLRARKAAKKKS